METEAADGGGAAVGSQQQLPAVKTEPAEPKPEPMDETGWEGAAVKCESLGKGTTPGHIVGFVIRRW